MSRTMIMSLSLVFTQLFASTSCQKDDNSSATTTTTRSFGIFTVQSDDQTVQMDGEIGDNTLSNYNKLVAAFPNVNQINIVECGGSSNDDINLQVSLLVFQKGFKIHLMDNGFIASGGVDFFLAGSQRTKGQNTQIGVHSWGGEDDNGNTVAATDFPVGHQHHQPYINYYQSIGFTKDDAEAFYYFTINAAGPDDIHWMTEAEISQYKVLKP